MNMKGEKTSGTKRLSRERIIIISVSALVIIGVAAVILAAAFGAKDSVDYIKDDLSKYIEISPEIYKNVEVDIPLLHYSDGALMREINSLLVKNKDKNALYNGANVTSVALSIGDVANIWYRGFTVENGVEKDIENASNFTESTAHKLELGSASFIAGIEEALIGVIPSQTPKFEKISSGKIAGSQVIYVSYDKYTADGDRKIVSNERIDLSSDKVDEIYGAGFLSALINQEIGKVIEKDMIFRIEGDSVDTVYQNFVVGFATECEASPISVDVSFPADYSAPDLRGKAVTFEIFVNSAVLYKTPAWNEDFILNTLKVKPEELSEYEGEGVVPKYESKLRGEINDEIEEKNKNLIEEAMWLYYAEKATVKHLPEDNVKRVYMNSYNDITAMFQSYSLYYNSLDEFATAYLGLSKDADWRAYIMKNAEESVEEKLVFYYIIREEGLIPGDAEYQRLYGENVAEMLEYYKDLYKTELDGCKTDGEREAKIAEIKAEMMEYYGEEYFREAVFYQYAIDGLLKFVTVKNG